MAKQGTNTFAVMCSRLESLGFVSDRRPESVVFTYPNGGPVILFPAYKSSEVVKPIHLMMVQKQLLDAGIVKAGMVPKIGSAKAKKTKTESTSIIAKKSKAIAKRGNVRKRGHKLEA